MCCSAAALRQTLSWIVEHHFSNVQFECDSLDIVRRVTQPDGDLSELANVVHDCVYYLHHGVDLSTCWISRQANEVAHQLARNSIMYDQFKHWSSVPAFAAGTV